MKRGGREVGVLGTGTMGAGIVQLAAQSGHEIVACDRSVEALEKAERYVREGLWRSAEKGVISREESETAYDRVRWTTKMEDMREAGAVVEAIVERVGPKKEALGALDALLPPDSLILTNTSSISITDLASATRRPERVCGTHFSPLRPCARPSRCRAASSLATIPSRGRRSS